MPEVIAKLPPEIEANLLYRQTVIICALDAVIRFVFCYSIRRQIAHYFGQSNEAISAVVSVIRSICVL